MIDDETEHRSERFSHALYGLIIVTAALLAEQEHINDVGNAIGLLLGTAAILLLVHLYTGWMAARSVEGHRLGAGGRRRVVRDNIPVVAAVIVPVAAFVMAGTDLITLTAAYRVSIGFSMVALIGTGIYQGRMIGLGWPGSVVSGVAAGGIGILLVIVEAVFD